MIRLKATTMAVSLEEITKIYWNEIWKLHGIPRRILSDRRPQFASKFMEDLTKALGTKKTLLIVYYPQTDGQMEQMNQEVKFFCNITSIISKMVRLNGYQQ